MQERITIMTPVCVTHNKWHICKSISPCLQCMPPRVSGMHARARCPKLRLYDSLVNPPKGLQNQGPPLVSPTDSNHHASNTWHFVRGTYTIASQFVSNTCHPWYSHLQNPRSALGTHISKTQGLPLVHILAKPKVLPWHILLQNPRYSLGTYFYKTQDTPLVRSHVATTMTTVKGSSSTKRTAAPLFGKTFN